MKVIESIEDLGREVDTILFNYIIDNIDFKFFEVKKVNSNEVIITDMSGDTLKFKVWYNIISVFDKNGELFAKYEWKQHLTSGKLCWYKIA